MIRLWCRAALFALVCSASVGSFAQTSAGVNALRVSFLYEGDVLKHPLSKGVCDVSRGTAGALAAVATDIAVSLAGKAVEAGIDYAAAKTKPDVTTLEEITPIPAFFRDGGFLAENSCIVIHNGTTETASEATFLAIFQIALSPDGTAFGFIVREWSVTGFAKPIISHWGQKNDVRDFALKIEFLIPGAENAGTRSIFWEKIVSAARVSDLERLFQKDQKLAWIAMPQKPSESAGATRPLNLKVSLVETTVPNQFATWLAEAAVEKKGEISAIAQNSVRRALDRSFAAEETLKATTAATASYEAYKAAWDAAAALNTTKPSLSQSPTTTERAEFTAWIAKSQLAQSTLDGKRILAQRSFSQAGLTWPGTLPNPFLP